MYNSRSIIPCVYTFDRVPDNGASEITLGVAPRNAPVYGVVQSAAHNVDVLTDLKENDRHARVLTYSDMLFLCHVDIFRQIGKDLLALTVIYSVFSFAAMILYILAGAADVAFTEAVIGVISTVYFIIAIKSISRRCK